MIREVPHTAAPYPPLLAGRFLMWVNFAEEQAVATGRFTYRAGVAVLNKHRDGTAVLNKHRDGVAQ